VTGDSEDHSWFVSVNLDSTIKTNLINQFKIGPQHPNLLQDSGVKAYPQAYPTENSIMYIPGFPALRAPSREVSNPS